MTPNFPSHTEPSAAATKSELHGVEQPHAFTLSAIPCFCAACRISSAWSGVKFRTTPPFVPAACTSLSATEFASWIGTVSSNVTIGILAALAIAVGPALMYPVPGTFDWSKTILLTPLRMTYCTAPSEL